MKMPQIVHRESVVEADIIELGVRPATGFALENYSRRQGEASILWRGLVAMFTRRGYEIAETPLTGGYTLHAIQPSYKFSKITVTLLDNEFVHEVLQDKWEWE